MAKCDVDDDQVESVALEVGTSVSKRVVDFIEYGMTLKNLNQSNFYSRDKALHIIVDNETHPDGVDHREEDREGEEAGNDVSKMRSCVEDREGTGIPQLYCMDSSIHHCTTKFEN